MKKRILASLMALCLLVGLIPTAAFAVEPEDSVPTVPAAEETSEQAGAVDTEEITGDEADAPAQPTNTLETATADTEGDKTVPGWVNNNNGHPKQIQETFDFVEENIAYSIVDGGVEVAPWYWEWEQHTCDQGHVEYVFCGTEYSNREDGLTIPKEITHNDQTYQVVGIGNNAFYNMTGTEVTLSEGLTYIGAGAFGYSTCKTIEIPASVTRLDKEALHGDFTSITFAEGSKLESIGDQAFRGCDITSMTLPSTVKSLGHRVFQACDSLASVEIPASVTEIQTDTFDGYFDADANEGEGNVAFAEGSIFKLQDGVLYDSENLIRVLDWQENVVVPEGIKYIGADAFNAYSTQTPNNMETLKSITLPESLVSIGKTAFRACKSLKSITIPKNVSEIGGGAFSSCSSLITAEILGPVKELTGTTGVFLGCAALKNVTLPDTLTSLGNGAFNGCKALEEINLPKGLTEIGREAFNGCESLKEAIIPSGVTKIPDFAFTGCLALEKVELPEGITSIGEYAFDLTVDKTGNGDFVNENPKLKFINIPSTVTSISGNFLGGVKANGGTALIFEGNTPPSFETDALAGISGEGVNQPTVYYPAEAVEAYTAEGSALVTNNLVSAPEEGEENNNQYSLTVTPSATSVYENNTISFTVESTLPQDAALTVESSDTTVATAALSSDQKSITVTGVKEGTATITVSIKLGDVVLDSDSVTVTVDERGTSGGGGGGGSSSSGDYIVSVDKTTHGKVTVSPSRADKGDTVTITVKPDKGYELDELTITDKNGDKIKLAEKDEGKFTFKMPGSKVTVEASFKLIETEPEAPAFVDVPADAYYADAVAWAVKEGITSGTSATTFTPNASCTRAQMVTFLWRANGSPVVNYAMSFTDVPADAYYAEAVRWAVSEGITTGTTATTFSPDATLTRAQAVTFIYRNVQAQGGGFTGSWMFPCPFTDVPADAYYFESVQWCAMKNITSGTSTTTFSPDATCTRAQIVTFIYRAD